MKTGCDTSHLHSFNPLRRERIRNRDRTELQIGNIFKTSAPCDSITIQSQVFQKIIISITQARAICINEPRVPVCNRILRSPSVRHTFDHIEMINI